MSLLIALALATTQPDYVIWDCTSKENGQSFRLTYYQLGRKLSYIELSATGLPDSYQRWTGKLEEARIWFEGPSHPSQFRWMELFPKAVPADGNLRFGTTFGSIADENWAKCILRGEEVSK